MAQLPAMNWWADAYWADTRHLTLEEHGAYRTLIDIAWRMGSEPIPDDDKRIALMLGTTRARWLKIKPAVMAFWALENGGWVQKRVQKEWKTAQERCQKARNKANVRWGSKSLKTNGGRHAVADAAANAAADAAGMLTTDHYTPNGVEQPKGCLSDEPTEPPITVSEIVEAWNSRMVPQGFPAVQRVTGTRLKHLKARIRENSVADFQQAMASLERSAFCRGENRDGWRADFDFFVQSKSFTKLLEGAYDH